MLILIFSADRYIEPLCLHCVVVVQTPSITWVEAGILAMCSKHQGNVEQDSDFRRVTVLYVGLTDHWYTCSLLPVDRRAVLSVIPASF